MEEKWLDINGYIGYYQISNYGRVKALHRSVNNTEKSKRVIKEKLLKPWDNGNGYLVVSLSKGQVRKNHYVHRLVAEYFIPNHNANYKHINHLDFVRTNNHYKNLEWVSPLINIRYSIKNGRQNITRGEQRPQSKITGADVKIIRKRASQGETYRSIANDYPIGEKQVGSICRYKKWTHI